MGKKPTLVLMLLGAYAVSHAQVPDVSIVTDVRFVVEQNKKESRARFYDLFGRHSTVTLNLNLETGYVARLSERFSRIDGDTASDQLEVAYISAPGLWKLGRIEAPFGRRFLVREYALGAELETFIVFDNLPVRVAAVNNGDRRARGVVGRLGEKIGVSLAIGNHFAASGTSLSAIRRPEDAPGIDRGYQTILGADAHFTVGDTTISGEFLSLRRGHTAADVREDLLDITVAATSPDHRLVASVSWTRGFLQRKNYYRAEAELAVSPKASLIGYARFIPGYRSIGVGGRLRF